MTPKPTKSVLTKTCEKVIPNMFVTVRGSEVKESPSNSRSKYLF